MFKDIRPEKLQQILVILFGCGVVAGMVVVGAYVYFHRDLGLALANSDWGAFGDFIGGILNPFYSFLAFLGLLFTISLQSKELEEARTATNKTLDFTEKQTALIQHQTAYLRQEQSLGDIEKAIRMQAELIDQTLEKLVYKTLGEHDLSTAIPFRSLLSNVADRKAFGFDPTVKFNKVQLHHLKWEAEPLSDSLKQLGVLLEYYDNTNISNSYTKATASLYTNVWRNRYCDYVHDLLDLKESSSVDGVSDDLLSYFKTRSPG